jgi:hypothetical protein
LVSFPFPIDETSTRNSSQSRPVRTGSPTKLRLVRICGSGALVYPLSPSRAGPCQSPRAAEISTALPSLLIAHSAALRGSIGSIGDGTFSVISRHQQESPKSSACS